tara:strand:+ start:437 stop:571 length:135 start_codon:yes stop_codon:yes gene_type:complete
MDLVLAVHQALLLEPRIEVAEVVVDGIQLLLVANQERLKLAVKE